MKVTIKTKKIEELSMQAENRMHVQKSLLLYLLNK